MVSEDLQDIQQRVTKKVCLACHREFTGVVAACPHDGTVLIPLAQDPYVGTKLADRYLIISVIGHGGMGVVYKARHELMDRVVAIKMLQSNLVSDSMSVKRFQQEAKAASKLKHPNVITLFDFGISPAGQPYLVMDFLHGASLADLIKKDGHVGVDRCVKIFTQACSALDHAHRQGVIHRDLKPGNIMLVEDEDEKDFVKVVDFGVAKLMYADDEEGQRLTQTGEVCGSPVYMSPEQCQGAKLTPASDIYSMGVVMYESLTGRLPLLGKTMVDTMAKHISEMPSPFSQVRPDLYIPERLEAVIFKALAKDPEQRQHSMEQLEQELHFAVPRSGKSAALRGVAPVPPGALELKPAAARPAAPAVPTAAVVALAAAVLVALGVFGFMLFNKPKVTPAAAPPAKPAQGPAAAPVKPAAPAPAPVQGSVPALSPARPKAPAAPLAPKAPAETTPAPAPPVTPALAPQAPAAAPAGPAAPAPARPPSPPASRTRATAASRPRPKKTAIAAPRPADAEPAPSPAPRPAVNPFEQLRRERSY